MPRPHEEPRSYAALPSRLVLRPRLRRSIKLSLLLLWLLLATAASAAFPGRPPWADALFLALLPGLVVLGVLLWLVAGRLELDRREIVLVTPLFRHRLPWNAVETVRVDPLERAIAFAGGRRRLVAPGPAWWGRDDEGYGLFWIEAVANENGVELEREVRRTPYLWCRGTRAWRWSRGEPPERRRYLRES